MSKRVTVSAKKSRKARPNRPASGSKSRATKAKPASAPASRAASAKTDAESEKELEAKRAKIIREARKHRHQTVIELRTMFGLDPYKDTTGASIIGMLGDLIEPEVDTVELLHDIRDGRL